MTLDTLDWKTVTRREAVSLRVAARRREEEVKERFNRDEATQAEFEAAMLLEENLHVFVLTGVKPDEDPSLKPTK